MIIPPTHLVRAGELDQAFLDSIISSTGNAEQSRGDFSAQISANRIGGQRLQTLLQGLGLASFKESLTALEVAKAIEKAAAWFASITSLATVLMIICFMGDTPAAILPTWIPTIPLPAAPLAAGEWCNRRLPPMMTTFPLCHPVFQ